MGDVLEGVKAPNGKVLKGVIAYGWGSVARVSVDQKSGDIGDINRVETPEDTKFKNTYLKYLEKQFGCKETASEALCSFNTLYTSGSFKELGDEKKRELRTKLIDQLDAFKAGDL